MDKRNRKHAAIITLDIIIDMYEWSDGCLGRKYEDLQWQQDSAWKRCIIISNKDFGIVLEYLGKHRSRVVTYRHYIIACHPTTQTHPIIKFLRKL